MRFTEFICNEALRPDLQSSYHVDVIQELVLSLAEAGQIGHEVQDSIVKAILKREELGTTAIGNGVAIPHVKHPDVQRVVGTVGVCHRGVDFNSLDGKPTEIFFLLISPPDAPGNHLRALEKTSRHLQDDMFRQFIKQAKTAAQIQEVLDEADQPQLVGPE